MIPIIFIHYGDTPYLKLTLTLAKKFNPGTDVYLLGDETNRKYSDLGIIHKPYKQHHLGDLLYELLRVFKCHTNISDKWKITFDFYRWFYLYNFIVDEGIDQCWYFDSDTFICVDLSAKAAIFKDYRLSLINHISGCACLINDRDAFRKYLELMIELYNDKEFVNTHAGIVQDHVERGGFYSLCDMTIFREYQKRFGPCGELSATINEESFDPNINLDRANIIEDHPVWEMETGTLGESRPIKNIYFVKNYHIPFCYNLQLETMVGMNTLNMSWIPYNKLLPIFEKINGGPA